MRRRIHIYIDDTTVHVLSSISKECDNIPFGQVVDMLVRERKVNTKASSIAELVADQVVQKLRDQTPPDT